MAKRRRTCQACGHKGGSLAEAEALAGFPEHLRTLAARASIAPPPLVVCGGHLFADDGAAACLRRMTARRA